MFDGTQKEAVMQAYDFACKVGKKHNKEIEKKASNDEMLILKVLRSEHSPEELQKRLFDLAIEYHNWKSPSLNDGLISNLENIEAQLKGLINKLDILKSTAPDTFDDIACLMYSPYLRGAELKAQVFTYYDPQTELKHLVRGIGLTKCRTQARVKSAKKEVLIGTVSNKYGHKLQTNPLRKLKIVILLHSLGWFSTLVNVPKTP